MTANHSPKQPRRITAEAAADRAEQALHTHARDKQPYYRHLAQTYALLSIARSLHELAADTGRSVPL